MGTEIEAKMKVDDLDAVRQRLRALGATRKGLEFETNTFFDTPEAKLRTGGSGLRLRVAKLEAGKDRCTITLKGPLQASAVKTREEIEFAVSDPEAAAELLGHLGYKPTLAFDKRRETWDFAQCEIALDELPYLGTYVEVEGPSDEIVLAARQQLGLAEFPLISTGYISMLARYVDEHKISTRHIKL